MAMLMMCSLSLAGNATAQSGQVTMPSRETTLKQALNEIQRQTGYMSVVNFDNVSPSRAVTLSSESLSADELMRQVLDGTGFTHEVMGRRILIVPAPPKIDDGAGAFSAMWRTTDDDESAHMEMITFRIGSSTPEAGFMDNGHAFEELDLRLTDTAEVARIDHISVTAASSPDGNTLSNERLAIARAQATKGYLARRYPHIAPEKIHTFSVGEEWTGLRRLVADDARTPNRDEVLDLLDNIPDENKRDTLRALADGRAWRYIAANMFPRLRGATAITMHFRDASSERRTDTVSVTGVSVAADSGVQRVEIVAAKPEPVPEVVPELPPVVEPRPMLAIKTNLLFDAASALNLEVEVPVGERWSVAAEVMFPWWMFVGGTLEGRYWWGDRISQPVLTGWFTGVYAGGGRYDLNWNSRTRKGNFFHVGLSGGYAHTINRSGNLRMEYSLGVGYLGGTRRLEENQREKYRWIGPTRAKVSLVWMFDRK